ncbi:MAG TPA: DRTGG domain-containing protein [Virgibacillus sp.]|nr:DRTGG domain-containing protein [Virgibacillus sp.]
MATKHEQIIDYIVSLNIGTKISVRQIAKKLHVSDGTAYRAIKEAQNQGFVSTIERVGTIRIKQKKKENIERLTFAEIIKIVEGQVLGGSAGMYKTLSKFLIGAMQIDAIARYTEADSLFIVGNRVDAQRLALNDGAAVLITGGFDTESSIKKLADEKELPLMSTSFDTFTVAAMINRAIYDQMIKKEIVFVRDIFTPRERAYALYAKDTLYRWYELNEQSSHTRFPVLDNSMRVKGIVTSKDIIGRKPDTQVAKVMTKNPHVVPLQTSLAYVAHMMIWEGIEIVPVVNKSNQFQGLVSRNDVIKALQQTQRQPQVGETIEEIVTRSMEVVEGETCVYRSRVTPQMTNQLGTLSSGVFTVLFTEASKRLLLYIKKGDLVVENISVYFMKPVPIDSLLLIYPHLLEAGRIYAKIEVSVYLGDKLVGKGLMMAQLMDR